MSEGLTRAQLLRFGAASSLALGLPFTAHAQRPTPMNTRPIPSSKENLPVIGCGTWLGFDYRPGTAEYQRLPGVLDALFAAGGTVIDSSPMYGRSEERVGDILASIRPATHPFLATKVWTTGRAAGESQLAESRRLMRTKTLDLVQVHNLQDLDTHLPMLRAARDAGTLRYIGVTHYLASAHAELERVIRQEKPDFLQINYSLAEPEAGTRLLPLARELGVAVLVNRPFTKGAMIDRAAGHALPPVAGELGCRSAAQLFVKWVLGDPAVTVVLAATRNPLHAAENLEAASGRAPNPSERKTIATWFSSL